MDNRPFVHSPVYTVKKIVPGTEESLHLPELLLASQLYLHSLKKRGEPFNGKQKLDSARTESFFFDGRVTLLTGPRLYYMNTLALPARSTARSIKACVNAAGSDKGVNVFLI